MSISGLVLTCWDDGAAADMRQRLQQDASVTVGDLRGQRLAVVLEVTDAEAATRWIDTVRASPAIADVAIAAIYAE